MIRAIWEVSRPVRLLVRCLPYGKPFEIWLAYWSGWAQSWLDHSDAPRFMKSDQAPV